VTFYLTLDAHAGAALRTQGITPLMLRAVALPAFLAPLAVAAVIPRVGAQPMVIAGLCTATTGLALCAWANSTHLHGLLAASVLFVAGVGVSVPSLIARVAGLADAPVRGLAVALYTFVLFVGASLGPWLAQSTAHWSLARTLSLLAALPGMAALYVFTGRNAIAPSIRPT
jgi:MFS family permease